jgi:hypothetical protein
VSPAPERWPSIERGMGPVQLNWRDVFGARRFGKTATVAAWVRDMRAAGHRVVEIGQVKDRPVAWAAYGEWLPMRPGQDWRVEMGRGGKSGPVAALLHPAFVEARRAAETDPASTFARPRFRPG